MAAWTFAIAALCTLALAGCDRDNRTAEPAVEQLPSVQDLVPTDLSTVPEPLVEGGILRIYFATEQAELTPAARDALSEVSARAAQDGAIIVAHPDATRPQGRDEQLSRRRAEAVRAYLAASGVRADRIEIATHQPQGRLADPEDRRLWIEIAG